MHSWKHIYGYLGTRMRRRAHARAVALLTPRPSLRVPRREMIVDPSPATSSKSTARPPARLHSQDTSGTGAVGTTVKGACHPSRHRQHRLRGRPHLVRSVVLAGVGRGGEHTSSYLGIQTCWVYVREENGLMIGIPKVLLEKNPGSSSSAFLHGFLDPGSACWG